MQKFDPGAFDKADFQQPPLKLRLLDAAARWAGLAGHAQNHAPIAFTGVAQTHHGCRQFSGVITRIPGGEASVHGDL